MSISPESINARSQPSAYSFAGSFDSATKPCKGWVAVEACYSDRWKTPLTRAPIRIADANGTVINGTANTRGLDSYGVTDGDTQTAALAELGQFRQAEVQRGRVDISAVPDPSGNAAADSAMAELGRTLTTFRDESIAGLRPWVAKWEQDGLWSIAEAQRDGVIRGLQSWWTSEADFWGGVSELALSRATEAYDWYVSQPWYVRYSPAATAGVWLWETISPVVRDLIGAAGDLAEHLWTIVEALKKFATGIVDNFEDGIDMLTALPGEFGELFKHIKETGQDWIERMILIASETNAFEYSFHCCMAVVMNMTPNFWAEMFGVASGYLLPEVLIEIILAVVAALSGGSTAGLLAGRLALLVTKVSKAAAGAKGLAIFLRVLKGFENAIAALKRIGEGLHRAISATARDASDRIVRLRHEVAQLEFKIDPNTLGMNGGNIRIVRKRMAKFDVQPCFDVVGYARRRAPGSGADQRRIIKEYTRQLSDQQNGLNDLTVSEYLAGRDAYNRLGRDGVSDGNAQSDARAALKSRIAASIFDTLDGRGVSPSQAESMANTRAEEVMKKLAALHNPDMIAGGKDAIGRVSDAGVNSSIGGSWGDYTNPNSRIATIDAAANNPSLDPNAKMNVNLPPCRS